jgi:hypothetical protein
MYTQSHIDFFLIHECRLFVVNKGLLFQALAHDRGQGAALNNAWSQSVIIGLCDVAGVAHVGR